MMTKGEGSTTLKLSTTKSSTTTKNPFTTTTTTTTERSSTITTVESGSITTEPGFANFGSMGIALATLGVFAPTRKRAITKIAPRALIAGNMVSLMTASIAGLLYDARHATVPILDLNSTVV
ncbi:unnamed protein product [Adineta steineri]|uniref:Concentrative nucleoside transporter C-terminal domain-containing protein n=1 Tax=Adineta steineri TaxID=433720 RepID=A0A815A8A3_9BILA|nr:unnamed protein product [Adineta steineri]